MDPQERPPQEPSESRYAARRAFAWMLWLSATLFGPIILPVVTVNRSLTSDTVSTQMAILAVLQVGSSIYLAVEMRRNEDGSVRFMGCLLLGLMILSLVVGLAVYFVACSTTYMHPSQ